MRPTGRHPPDDPREWLRRAASSLALARARPAGVDLEDLCFAAQQAAEKAVKAVFVRRGADPPRTHDLARLLSLLADAGEQVPAELYAAAELTPYAVGARYPGALRPLTEAEHLRALDVAQQVFEWARSLVKGGGRA